MATTVAGLEPEMAAKKVQESTEAMASPPGIQPTRVVAKRMMRRAAPPAERKAPQRTKKGMDMMTKLSSPVNSFCETMAIVSTDSEETNARKASTVSPRAMEMGMPVSSRANRMAKMTKAVIASPRTYGWAARRCDGSARAPAESGNT